MIYLGRHPKAVKFLGKSGQVDLSDPFKNHTSIVCHEMGFVVRFPASVISEVFRTILGSSTPLSSKYIHKAAVVKPSESNFHAGSRCPVSYHGGRLAQ